MPLLVTSHLFNTKFSLVTYFKPMFQFCTHWKQKTSGFLMFSEGIEMEHWLKTGKCRVLFRTLNRYSPVRVMLQIWKFFYTVSFFISLFYENHEAQNRQKIKIVLRIMLRLKVFNLITIWARRYNYTRVNFSHKIWSTSIKKHFELLRFL